MNRLIFVSLLSVMSLGVFFPNATFAAPASTTVLARQQQSFHTVLDTYLKANTETRERIEQRADVLDDRTEAFLFSLVRGEESAFLSLRSDLYSTTSTKEVAALARKAKQTRDTMKTKERTVITPLLDVSDIVSTLLPTAELRLAGLDSALTKQRYDVLEDLLRSTRTDAERLQRELVAAKPPTNAVARVRMQQNRIKQFYANVRAWVK